MPRESQIVAMSPVTVILKYLVKKFRTEYIHLIIHHLLMDGYKMSVSWPAKSVTPALAWA